MLKHATIRRTNEAQQGASFTRQWSPLPTLVQQHEDTTPSNTNNIDQVDGTPLASPIITGDHTNSSSWFLSRDSRRLVSSSCSVSPAPPSDRELASTPILSSKSNIFHQSNPSSAPSSLFNTPSKRAHHYPSQRHEITLDAASVTAASTPTTSNKSSSESTIKIFAQTLSQEVEYVTLQVNSQTKSKQIIRSLLKKFRLKHRDPNLFYLTLERWIRKDGLKSKSIMLLGDDACPMQLQQCCSSPPYSDIKFTLQMRTGALMKIHCSDVCPETCYKCLSLSTQTTVDETIDLMLHCLNLHGSKNNGNICTNQRTQTSSRNNHHHIRQASSPCDSLSDSSSAKSSASSSSSASTSSSSSGIESDPTNASKQLDSNSRASSVTSISSSSNVSNNSSLLTSDSTTGPSNSTGAIDLYCLVIECLDTNSQRVLESDEYLVDVYQNLLAEVNREVSNSGEIPYLSSLPRTISTGKSQANTSLDSKTTLCNDLIKRQPDQWFVIKLKRRSTISPLQLGLIKTTNPYRQMMPLPPIPQSLSLQFNNANELKNIVSTAHIEVNTRPSNSLALAAPSMKAASNNHHQRQQSLMCNTNQTNTHTNKITAPISDAFKLDNFDGHQTESQQTISLQVNANNSFDSKPMSKSGELEQTLPRISRMMQQQIRKQPNTNPFVDDSQHHYGNVQQSQLHHRQMSAICTGSSNAFGQMPPPPANLILLPSVRPRKRNLSNASSTFQRPQISADSRQNQSLKATHSFASNRRRYDPIQLAKDLNELDLVDDNHTKSS